jgi:outer membrane protein assembly factor BamB
MSFRRECLLAWYGIDLLVQFSQLIRLFFVRKIPIVIIGFLLLSMATCDISGPNDTLREKLALFVTFEYNHSGVVIMDANTMELLDTLRTPALPRSIEISNDYHTWYLLGANDRNHLIAMDSRSRTVIKDVFVGDYTGMALSPENTLICLYGMGFSRLVFVDTNTFEVIKVDTTVQGVTVKFLSDDILYVGQGDYIFEYDVTDFSIKREFPMSRGVWDMAISPVGEKMFVTTPSTISENGTFYTIDLVSGDIIDQHAAGKYSRMAITPDGKHVYVTDPAGIRGEAMATNKLLRYNVDERRMDVFMEGTDELGYPRGTLITRYAFVSPDGENLFLFLGGGGVQLPDGKRISNLKLDIKTKGLIGYFTFPKGWGVLLWDVKLSKVKD